MNLKYLFFTTSLLSSVAGFTSPGEAAESSPRLMIDLAGEWRYSLADVPDSVADSGILILPGTLDTNSAGIPVPDTGVTTQLSRRHTYQGKASFSKTIQIPESWAGKTILLNMERTRPTSVKVDGVDAGFRNSISAPQVYDLSRFLTPGHHTIEITVDNDKAIPEAVRNNSHACTESTQTNWNGIIGDFYLSALNPAHFADIRISPDADTKSFSISGTVTNPDRIPLYVTATAGGITTTAPVAADNSGTFSTTLSLLPSAQLWSEWNPALTEISLSLKDDSGNLLDTSSRKTGLRRFSTSGTHFTINGDTTFLRGRHDAAVWPLTAHVPTDKESWRRYFSILKEYGLNHVRFHSWTPPEACFAAADEAGVYLQPELTIWGQVDDKQAHLTEFLTEDMKEILKAYSHHPSFTMFAIGNELWGDTAVMRKYIDKARETVPGLLATYGSNIYLGWNGHIPGEDYLVTCRVGGGPGFSTHSRASFSFADADNGGIMNSSYPNTTSTFSNALSLSPVPVVGHETGQYQFYPDYAEIDKYTGVLRADNLKAFRERADKAGTLRKAGKYYDAAGKWAARLYKADTEMNLRTPGMGGFQLLDIQDYPGQGTALVGILDAFLDSKGFVTPEQWREACSDLTVLALLPKYCFSSGETIEIPLRVANYSLKNTDGSEVVWTLPFATGKTSVAQGKGVVDAGVISLPAPGLKKPEKVTLSLKLADTLATNSYDLWIFPAEERLKPVKNVTVTDNLDHALTLLADGKRVILCPDSATTSQTTIGPLFTTDYWNYRMFKTIAENAGKTPSPGTMGLLIDDTHPMFDNFPTNNHTDWQWFSVASNSRPLIIDRLPSTFDPTIEPIDNIERDYRLALLMECWVGDGRLMIIMADKDKVASTPEGRWFLRAAEEYIASKECKPRLSLSPRQLRDLLTRPTAARRIEQLNNISY